MINESEYLKQGLNHIGVEIEEPKLNAMLKFKELVLETNKSLNLTSITEDDKFIDLHIIDSLTVLKRIPDNSSVIDVGTGAGFPGMILKIANPTLDITLLDSTQKRLSFIDSAICELKLDNVRTLNARAEELSVQKDYREQFDVCVSRAVAKLPILCEYCIPFVKEGGLFIAMKGANCDDEISLAGNLPFELGCSKEKRELIELPNSEGVRNIIYYEKTSSTPTKYPRKNSVLKKLYK